MVKRSVPPVPPTLRVTTRVLELLNETEAEVISTPAVNVILGGAEVLNSNPAGALSTSVKPEPELISLLFPSRITIRPSVVHAGEMALAAVSARILVPPVALVIVTVPQARPAIRNAAATSSWK